MLNIENNVVFIGDESIELPKLPVGSNVKVWKVPKEYVESGFFVSTTEIGGIEEVPACSSSDVEFIGAVYMEPNQDAVFELKKKNLVEKIQEKKVIARDGGLFLNGIKWDTDERAQTAYMKFAFKLMQYPQFEILDWKASDGVWVKMDSLIFDGLQVELAKHETDVFTWQRQKEAEIAACTTIEELEAIEVNYA